MGCVQVVRDPEAKKLRISEVATELFVKKGFFPTTLADIAKEAGVSKGTIILHFKSKENLARELKVKHFKSLREHLKACSKNYGSVEDCIRLGVADYVKWCVANPYPARFQLALRQHDFIKDLECRPRDEAYEESVKVIRQGQKEGSVRAGNPEFLARTMSAPASKMVRLVLEWGNENDLMEMADSLGDLAWRIVRSESSGSYKNVKKGGENGNKS